MKNNLLSIKSLTTTFRYTLLLHIYHHDGGRPKTNYRLIWCPYLSVDDEDNSDEPEKMFVVLNGTKGKIVN